MKRRFCPPQHSTGIEPAGIQLPSPQPLGLANAQPGITSPSNTTSSVWDLPADLSLANGKPTLLKLCFEAVQQVGAIELAGARNRFVVRKGVEGDPMPARPEMLTTLLTYSYAIGLYASEDIETAAGTDATLRYICSGYRPDAPTLRRFRRHHRALLRTALVHVFTQTWTLHFERGEANYAGCDWFEAELTAQLERAATGRLDVAVLLDEVD